MTAVDVFQKMSPSTVTVLATDATGKNFMGTGVLLTADGYFLTNAHVVSGTTSCIMALDTGVPTRQSWWAMTRARTSPF